MSRAPLLVLSPAPDRAGALAFATQLRTLPPAALSDPGGPGPSLRPEPHHRPPPRGRSGATAGAHSHRPRHQPGRRGGGRCSPIPPSSGRRSRRHDRLRALPAPVVLGGPGCAGTGGALARPRGVVSHRSRGRTSNTTHSSWGGGIRTRPTLQRKSRGVSVVRRSIQTELWAHGASMLPAAWPRQAGEAAPRPVSPPGGRGLAGPIRPQPCPGPFASDGRASTPFIIQSEAAARLSSPRPRPSRRTTDGGDRTTSGSS